MSDINRLEEIINGMTEKEFFGWLYSITNKKNKMKKQTLPSARQIGDKVTFVLNKIKHAATVAAVRFEEGKVYYDLDLHVKYKNQTLYTLVKEVDSAFITASVKVNQLKKKVNNGK